VGRQARKDEPSLSVLLYQPGAFVAGLRATENTRRGRVSLHLLVWHSIVKTPKSWQTFYYRAVGKSIRKFTVVGHQARLVHPSLSSQLLFEGNVITQFEQHQNAVSRIARVAAAYLIVRGLT